MMPPCGPPATTFLRQYGSCDGSAPGAVRRRRQGRGAGVRGPRMVAAGARREEACGEPELGLAVIAVVATDAVTGVGPAAHAALEIEEPDEPAVERIDRVEPA